MFKDISKVAENSATKAEEEKEKEAAATKIQAAFRAHNVRKSLRVSETASKQTRTDEEPEEQPTQEQLQEEFRADDQGERLYTLIWVRSSRKDCLWNNFYFIDLLNAATKIQATFRGHMSRKEVAAAAKSAMTMVESATAKIEEKVS